MILCDVCCDYATSRNAGFAVCDECAKGTDTSSHDETPHAEIARDLNGRNAELNAVSDELYDGALSDSECQALAIRIRKAIAPNWSQDEK